MANPRHLPERLAVQSDRRMVREALAAYFSAASGFTVVGHTDSLNGLRTLCAVGRPEVCLIDVRELTTQVVDALRDIRTAFPAVDVVVAYDSLPLDVLAEAARAGITWFIPSSRGLDAVQRLLRQRTRRPRAKPPSPSDRRTSGGQALTDRELGVISLMSAGHTVSGIARVMQISPHTVDKYKRRLYAKFGVGSQGMAISRAIALGLVAAARREQIRPGRAGHPPLAVVYGPAGPVLDQVIETLVARMIPFVHARTREPLANDHWARWHRGPIIAVLVDPSDDDRRLSDGLHSAVVEIQSTNPDLPAVVDSLATGARALLHANDVPAHLADVLSVVTDGYVALNAQHAAELAGWMAARSIARSGGAPLNLTAREEEILGLLARGDTIRQAARTLGIAAKTVENTQARLYRKLGTHNRAETLAVAYRLGLLDPTAGPPS